MPFNAQMEAASRIAGNPPTNSIDAVSWLERRSRANLSVGQRVAGKMYRGYNKAAMRGLGSFWRAASSPMRGTMITGGALAAFTHDNTQNTFASHMAQEGLKLGGDALMEGGIFAATSLATTLIGGGLVLGSAITGIGIAASAAAHYLEINPGALIGKSLEGAKQAYRKKQNNGITPITQNERTMQATAQNLRMLGQSSGRYSMLGHEAQFMHN